jgi:hypothetical protein
MKKELKKFTLENYDERSALVIKRRLLDANKKELDLYVVPKKSDSTCLTVYSSDFEKDICYDIMDMEKLGKDREVPVWIEDTILESGDYVGFRVVHNRICEGQFDSLEGSFLKFKSLWLVDLNYVFLEEDTSEYDFTYVHPNNIDYSSWITTEEKAFKMIDVKSLKKAIKYKRNSRLGSTK